MHRFVSPTLTSLHEDITDNLIFGTKNSLDEYNSVDVQLHNITGYAKSMEWEFDLKDLWLTPSRWTSLVRQYIDPQRFEIWMMNCEKIDTKKRGIAVLRTNTVEPRVHKSSGKMTRRWGSCMLAISYKAVPKPQITLYSRTSYLGYIGALDLSVAWTAARYVANLVGIETEQMSFLWYNEMAQYHGFKSLAYIYSYRPDLVPLLEESAQTLRRGEYDWKNLRCPALKISRKWLQKIIKEYDEDGKTYGEEKYNTYLRIIRRYHTETRGYEEAQEFESDGTNPTERGKVKKAYQPLPSTPVYTLDFSKIGFPL